MLATAATPFSLPPPDGTCVCIETPVKKIQHACTLSRKKDDVTPDFKPCPSNPPHARRHPFSVHNATCLPSSYPPLSLLLCIQTPLCPTIIWCHTGLYRPPALHPSPHTPVVTPPRHADSQKRPTLPIRVPTTTRRDYGRLPPSYTTKSLNHTQQNGKHHQQTNPTTPETLLSPDRPNNPLLRLLGHSGMTVPVPIPIHRLHRLPRFCFWRNCSVCALAAALPLPLVARLGKEALDQEFQEEVQVGAVDHALHVQHLRGLVCVSKKRSDEFVVAI